MALRKEESQATSTTKETPASVLEPVLSCVASFHPALAEEEDVNAALAILGPSLRDVDVQHQFASSWVNDVSNAPYLAAAQALAARDDDAQLQLLQPKQRAACLILERIEESLAKTNDQTRTSVAALLTLSYGSLVAGSLSPGSPYTPAFTEDIATRLSALAPDSSFTLIIPFLGLGKIAMAGQNFLTSCLSIDPVTGTLEPEGLCEVGAKLRLHLDSKTGRPSVIGNEAGGGEGARQRAARFKKLVNECVARSEEERVLLAWVYEDPIYGKSLEEWLWTGRLEVNKEKAEMSDPGRKGAFEMHWAGGGGGKEAEAAEGDAQVMPIEDVDAFAQQEALWGFSLAFLAVTVAGVWHKELYRLVTASGASMSKKGGRQDPLALSGLEMSLNSRLSNLALSLASMNKLAWIQHSWTDGDTFSVTLLDPTPDVEKQSRLMRPCSICEEMQVNKMVGLSPCTHDMCETCWHRHWEASTRRQPMDPVRCPFCTQVVAGTAILTDEDPRYVLFSKGGSIVINFMSVMQEISNALQWACQATDPRERPPLPSLPVKLVRFSIVESDGKTVGTATSFVEDGLMLERVVSSTCVFGASLNERVTPDGRHQCMWIECMKVEKEGDKPFARCASCRIVRYCSPECQKKAWGKGFHKRMCKKYKEVVDARGGQEGASK